MINLEMGFAMSAITIAVNFAVILQMIILNLYVRVAKKRLSRLIGFVWGIEMDEIQLVTELDNRNQRIRGLFAELDKQIERLKGIHRDVLDFNEGRRNEKEEIAG